jgi:superfamily II DNA or RNA helicase
MRAQAAALLHGWLYVPLQEIGTRDDLERLKLQLRHQPRAKDGEEPPPPVHLYREEDNYLLVPRAYGLQRFQHLPVEDWTSLGEEMQPVSKRPNPHHPRVRDPVAQAKFMADLIAGAHTFQTFTASAATGSGKTVCALNMAAELGRKTIVLTHLERLLFQWRDEIIDKLGVDPDRIGIVQGPRCEWEGKDFVLGMLHTMNLRGYPPEFYDAFGTMIVDEVHKVGTTFFAPTIPMFPARYKLGLSATMKRKDSGEKVFMWHLGPVRVVSTAEALPMKVYTIPYRNDSYRNPMKNSQKHGGMMKALTLDPRRNMLIADRILKFHQAGRQALIISDSVLHLQKLMELSEKMGVPRSSMGQFTAEIVVDGKKRKQKALALSIVKDNASLIFATYGMMTEGIDIPRLDAGIDATPRSSATQLVGRIRRPVPGKKEPVWITLRDEDCSMALRYYKARLRDYLACGAEVVNNGRKAQNRAYA